MIIRLPYQSDKPEINRIYSEFFSQNEYPDFLDKKLFPCAFIIANNDDTKIIVAGGVKTIVEAIAVSDQSLPVKVRLDAMIQALGSIISIAKEMNYSQVHVFVNNDDKYVGILQKFGFKLLDAKVLILDVGDSSG